MDTSLIGLARNLVLQGPRLATTLALAILRSISQDTTFPQDIITELAVILIRPILGTPIALLESQTQLRKDWGTWGPMQISKCTFPKPRDSASNRRKGRGLKEALSAAIEYLGDEKVAIPTAELADVEVEWTGYRSTLWPMESKSNVSERERYLKMIEGLSDDCPVILYFHGGAHW
jgi:hypothetical protein